MAETERESGQGRTSVLRRKMQAGHLATHQVLGPQKAVRLAVARAAQKIGGLDLIVAELEESFRSLAEILELLPERALLAVLEGPGDGLGLMALAPPVLGAVLEVQTTGRLAAGERPARRPTRTDAAMTAGLIDQVMTLLEEELDAAPDRVWAGGFRYASFLDDPRPLGLLLEDIPYRVYRITAEMGSGQRKGELMLALPAEGRGRLPRHPGPDTRAVDRAEAQEWAAAMDEVVMGASAVLTAVLHRMRIPLSAVMGLKPGELVPVPAAALERIDVEGLDGRWLGEGRLGQNRGLRAVRVTRLPEGRRPADMPQGAAAGVGAGVVAPPPILAPPAQIPGPATDDLDDPSRLPALAGFGGG